MWWFVAAIVIGTILAPSPKPQSSPPAGLGDIKAPVAEEGLEIPVLFGTRDFEGPNVTWYGDLRTKAIRKSGGKK